jgi:serine/threonine protein kinase
MPRGGEGAAGSSNDAAAANTANAVADARTPSSSRRGRGWKAAKSAVSLASSFSTLRDMVGTESFVEPSRLRFVRRLGEGGFAKVELCELEPPAAPPQTTTTATPTQTQNHHHHQQNQHLVAVKRLHPHLVATPREFETFAKEVALLKRLRHPHIARFVGAGALATGDASSAYVVQEYVSGGTLKMLITRHVLTRRAAGRRARARSGSRGAGLYRLGDAVDVALQVARALEYLHARSPMVIHRDVKPDNVLLAGPWPSAGGGGQGGGGGSGGSGASAPPTPPPLRFEAKLTDFGLSATVDARKAQAMRELVSRASQRCRSASASFSGQGASADAAAAAAVAAADEAEQDEPLRRLAAEGEQALGGSFHHDAADDHDTDAAARSSQGWAVEGHSPLPLGGSGGGRTPVAAAPSPPASRRRPSSSTAADAEAFNHRLDAVFDRRLSSRAMLSPALLFEEQQEQGEEEAGPRRPLSAPASTAGSDAAVDPQQIPHQVYELTALTGSLFYMAPEVFRASGGGGDGGAAKPASTGPTCYNEKADVFSFGVMLRELLAAYLLSFAFRDQAEVDAYAERVSRGYRPPIDERWPQALRSLVADCWQQDPRRRPSMSEVASRLQAVVDAGGLPRVAVDGGGWDEALGEVGGEEVGGRGGGGDGGVGGGGSRSRGAQCCVVM